VKHFSNILSLSIIFIFTITLSAQTLVDKKTNAPLICQAPTKSFNQPIMDKGCLSQKTIPKVKQRRLKSYRNNHKIVRKRKIVVPKNILVSKD